jgi:hypothetical protein
VDECSSLIPGGWDSKDDAMLLLAVFFHGCPITTEAWQGGR